MSVVFEPRTFHGDIYPAVGEHDVSDLERFGEADVSDVADLAVVAAGTYDHASSPFLGGDSTIIDLHGSPTANVSPLLSASTPVKEDSPSNAQSRNPIPKPDREVTKNLEGKYCCTWPDCMEDVKDFGRKCEWSKHMDKHERPYRCSVSGCEKLPGFTYSGGLLRHEREVHGKYGGPKNPLRCPHTHCKRHTGKGFSRQENLAEHLRRVHTGTNLPSGGEDTDDGALSDGGIGIGIGSGEGGSGGGNNHNGSGALVTSMLGTSVKRKREMDDSGGDSRLDFDPANNEMRRLQLENQGLRKQLDTANGQIVSLMGQLLDLQRGLGTALTAEEVASLG